MKKIFSNSEICHVFCNRVQNEGRTSNNSMFFDNNVLYSYGYHFELAKFIEFNGETYLFVNTASYSNTTSKHQSKLRSSINREIIKDVFFFDFKFYGGSYIRSVYEFKLDQYYLTDIIKDLIIKAKNDFNTQLKAFSNSHHYYNGTDNLQLVKRLIHIFGEVLTNSVSLLNEIEKTNWVKNSAMLKAHKILSEVEVRNERKKEREKIKALEAREKEKENLNKWLNHEFNGTLYNSPIHLRLKDDQVQTSKGANVPLEHARHIISLFDKGLDIVGKKIGYYTINEVTLDYIKIGCHKMFFSDVNGFIDQHLRD